MQGHLLSTYRWAMRTEASLFQAWVGSTTHTGRGKTASGPQSPEMRFQQCEGAHRQDTPFLLG